MGSLEAGTLPRIDASDEDTVIISQGDFTGEKAEPQVIVNPDGGRTIAGVDALLNTTIADMQSQLSGMNTVNEEDASDDEGDEEFEAPTLADLDHEMMQR